MLRLLKQKWWKWLSLLLVLYSTIAGLAIPLSSGIIDVNPDNAKTGDMVTVSLSGYNTNFTTYSGDRLYNKITLLLKNDSNSICASKVYIEGPQKLAADFDIPADLKVSGARDMYNIIVNDTTDGTFFLRNAFAIQRKDSTNGTNTANCKTDVAFTHPAHTTFPYRVILYETIRNLYFHVPMWFTMISLLIFSFGSSLAYLNNGKPLYDTFAEQSAIVALLFGTLGLLTGMVWARFTWGAFWTNDPRLNGAAVGMLVYLAYFVLRGSLDNEIVRAKVSAVYSIFAFVIYIVFIFIVPRMHDSLHPGTGGNPAFSSYDLDNTMRKVFYPACMGFILLGFWIMSIRIRLSLAEAHFNDLNSYYEKNSSSFLR